MSAHITGKIRAHTEVQHGGLQAPAGACQPTLWRRWRGDAMPRWPPSARGRTSAASKCAASFSTTSQPQQQPQSAAPKPARSLWLPAPTSAPLRPTSASRRPFIIADLPDGALQHALGFLDFRERCVWRAACCLTMWSMVLDNRSGSLRARHVLPDCRRCSPPLLPPLPQRWCPSALRRCAAALGCCERQMCSSTASQPQTMQLHG